MKKIELGKSSGYPDRYDKSLLEPIVRKFSREKAGVKPSFLGRDLWTAYELSWLDSSGLPRVAIAQIDIDAASDATVESKSLKYYLNSYNQTSFASAAELVQTLKTDLSEVCGLNVQVELRSLDDFTELTTRLPGTCVDDLECSVDIYQPDADILSAESSQQTSETLYSHLLKSNCPVTDQPDWATVWVQYKGAKIQPESFLKYIVAFRQYQGFHESCVERIFSDIQSISKAESLCVYARYTRRGGLDINPLRYTEDYVDTPLPFSRLTRQ